jgi:hypothetical protein
LEEIAVLDARHPLFGKTFKVIRLLSGGGKSAPSYEVEYLGTDRLIVPVTATDASNANGNQTKLSVEAIFDLISTVELLEDGVDRSGKSLGDAAGEPAPDDHRRDIGDPGGDAP